ncbi:hypothetical protein PC116_g22518 [Phytophthora cactorum]|nr:hypothetical protein PC116_g22518 [Phytophthora cactorum]
MLKEVATESGDADVTICAVLVNSNAELSQNEAAATTNEASAATTLLLEAAAESESLGSNAKALVLKREDCELLQDVDASSETETASAGEANDVTVNTYASHGSEIAATDNSMALIASIKTSASSTNTKLPSKNAFIQVNMEGAPVTAREGRLTAPPKQRQAPALHCQGGSIFTSP